MPGFAQARFPRRYPAEPERHSLYTYRTIRELEARTDLALSAWAALLIRLAPRVYRERRRRSRPAVCRTRRERVDLLAARRARGVSLWHRRDMVLMPSANQNTGRGRYGY